MLRARALCRLHQTGERRAGVPALARLYLCGLLPPVLGDRRRLGPGSDLRWPGKSASLAG